MDDKAFSIELFGVNVRVRDDRGRELRACIGLRTIAHLLGRTFPEGQEQVGLLEVQERKLEFVDLLFDNVERGVLHVRGDGRRNREYRFGWANPGFSPDWQASPAAAADSAERAWRHIAYLRERFADFYAERAAARLAAS